MTIRCTITVVPHDLGAHSAAVVEKHLAAAGWSVDGGGVFSVLLPASPTAVDAPAVSLGTMLQRFVDTCPAQGDEAASVVACRYGEEEVFTDHLRVRAADDGTAGLVADAATPPFFSDLIRLRDKILATIQKVHRAS